MELKHIDIACLSISPANMRGVKRAPDLNNILPSVRARGVLVPLIVRQNGSPTTYEIVAGKRRYHAAMIVAQEEGSVEPLPCAIMEAGDDAAALEASLIENIARLDPDEVTRWETFTRLVKEGRSPEDISLTFAVDLLARPDATIFPYPAYLIGLREKWLFSAPFDVRPIDLGEADAWGTVKDADAAKALEEFLADLDPAAADAG